MASLRLTAAATRITKLPTRATTISRTLAPYCYCQHRSLNDGAAGAAAARTRGRGRGGRRRRVSVKEDDNLNNIKNKKILFQSLGCPRNFVDTEVMLGYAVSSSSDRIDGGDMLLADNADDADVIVINTCGFLESAREESRAAIADAQDAILKQKSNKRLLVTGCMVNLPKHRDSILRDFPGVDAILPSGDIDKIVGTLRDLEDNDDKEKFERKNEKKKEKVKRGNDESSTSNNNVSSRAQRKSFIEKGDTPRFLATPPHYSYLKIAEGCRKRCSFCIIPKLKGRLQSKPISQVVEEFKAIIEHGTAREVILIAQDLGKQKLLLMLYIGISNKNTSNYVKTYLFTVVFHSYFFNSNKLFFNKGDYGLDFRNTEKEKKKSQLTPLLKAILSTMDDNDDDPFWLRLLYLYPDEITPDLIDLMEADRRIVRYVDLPIQHSHDDILKAMRRKTDSKHIKDTIANLRERLPDIYIRTSLMVGFPGETEEHFLDLLQFVKESKLDHVGVFIYSNEDMAYSSRLDGQVPEDVKQDRYRRLMKVQWKIVEERHKERVHRSERLRIVVEGLKEIDEDIDDVNDSTSSLPSTTAIVGRHAGQCPEIDGQIILEGFPSVNAGERYWVEVTGTKKYTTCRRLIIIIFTITNTDSMHFSFKHSIFSLFSLTGYDGYDLIGRVLSEEELC
jgi:ribosomal protein S12 methylthiotransferase